MKGRKLAALSVVAALLLASLAVCVVIAATDTETQQSTKEPARSLDIVSYDPPKWGGGRVTECWYLVDRLNSHRFWLLKIDGQWIPLDIGEVANLG